MLLSIFKSINLNKYGNQYNWKEESALLMEKWKVVKLCERNINWKRKMRSMLQKLQSVTGFSVSIDHVISYKVCEWYPKSFDDHNDFLTIDTRINFTYALFETPKYQPNSLVFAQLAYFDHKVIFKLGIRIPNRFCKISPS